ncbi:MAG TPA: F0F1 ATP synthase subunit A [Bryobacteraceae bacterium]|nr:F0F1 ATP synthase subunit A [Bryobacteraceae bacterium]
MEHELWLTALFNKFLAGPANAALALVGMKPADPAHPWVNFVTMEIAVALLIVVVFALLRPRLSVDRPGKFQHIFELIYGFLHGQTDDVAGHAARPFLAFFGTMFIFVLFGNLIGLIPTFESPTMFVAVPLGCALATFGYYNVIGITQLGPVNYLKHFAGPVWWLAPLMFPIEIISNLARPLSLTVRLYANMFGGEKVTMAFFGLLPLLLPIPFMALHIFVGVLQAYVFALLTMVYVGGVLPHEEH